MLRERQGLTHDGFLDHRAELLEALGERELPGDHYERAIGYPWERPPGSCLAVDAEVRDVTAERDGDLIEGYIRDAERIPLLAYGANASPGRLALKFADLPDGDRSALILGGWLEDFDIGAAAQPPLFSSMPGTVIPSAGTAVRVAVLFLTPVQFTRLWWTELSYKVGALNGIALTCDCVEEPIRRVIAFVSRYGAFCADGTPVALSAIPARDRRHPALEQVEVLAAAARLLLGHGATAHDLVTSAYEKPAAFMREHYGALRKASIPFASEHWEELPIEAGRAS
jgi:hypothetical protein